MQLFRGSASFSPAVSPTIKQAWIDHGGSIPAKASDEQEHSMWHFCSGLGDSRLDEDIVNLAVSSDGGKRLSKRRVVVFHADWILAAVTSKFLIPLSNFVLDSRFNVLKDREPFLQDGLGSVSSANLAHKSSAKRKKDVTPMANASPAKELRRKRPRTADPEPTKDIQRNSEKTVEGCSDDEVLMHIQEDGNVPPQVLSDAPPSRSCTMDASLPTVAEGIEVSVTAEPAKADGNITVPFDTNNVLSMDIWKTLLHGELTTEGVPTMLVSDALSSLSCLSIEDVAIFLPGVYHLGKQFIYTPNVRRKTV